MLEVPTWAQSSILIFATDEHIWQISATKVWNREKPPLFCSALPDSQLCSASNTRALRLACSAELAAGWIAVTLPALPVFSPHKAREQLWRPEMNGRSTKESFKFIWIKLERERQECNNSSGSNQKLNWERKQCMWSTNQKLTFLYLKVVVTLHLHWSLIETTGTKGERRWRRIFVRFEGSGCLLAACSLHSCPALLLLLLPSTNATL